MGQNNILVVQSLSLHPREIHCVTLVVSIDDAEASPIGAVYFGKEQNLSFGSCLVG